MGVGLDLPPGFRFHPTDEELVTHYLCPKCASQKIAVSLIADVHLYNYDPWELPGMALYGEKEWYFFSPRDRKYPNGSRPNRAAGSGYWKATGADKPVGHPKPVGIKKALVFYAGKPPRGQKTNWIMHEYRLADVDRSPRKNNTTSLRLDDWVLCRIYNKKGTLEKHIPANRLDGRPELFDGSEIEEQKPKIPRKPPVPGKGPGAAYGDVMQFDASDSVPRLHTESSCSEQVASPELEVQSEPAWEEIAPLDFPFSYVGALDHKIAPDGGFLFGSSLEFQSGYQILPPQDIFVQRPFY